MRPAIAYPAQVWVNGHEWATRREIKAGVAFDKLADGFASCDDPDGLQAICDRLGFADIWAFFDRGMTRIPTPLHDGDRAAGYLWSCRCAGWR